MISPYIQSERFFHPGKSILETFYTVLENTRVEVLEQGPCLLVLRIVLSYIHPV